jgi:hypothetical protein
MSPSAERGASGCPRCALRRGGVAALLTLGLLTSGVGTALAVVTPIPPTPVPATSTAAVGESWAAELALDGGDDSGVTLSDGGVRLSAPGTPGQRAEGVLTLAPRRLAAPTSGLAGVLTADLPPGTGVDVQVRGLDRRGAWGDWLPVRAGTPARFSAPTVDVQVRLLLHGGPDGVATPVVREVWLSALGTSPTTTKPAPTTTTTTKPTSTTTRPTTTTPVPTSTKPTPPGPTTTAPPTTTTTAPPPTTTTPPPTTTTTTTAAPAGAVGSLWNAAIATTGLKGFKDTPYNITGSASVTVVDGPPKAIRFSVPSGSQRAEIEPDVGEFSEGQARYFRLTYVLPASFPADPRGFQLATQWKNDGDGSPPLELRIEKGHFVLGGGYGRPGGSRLFSTDVAPVITGRPVDIVVGVRFSSDPAKGRVDVWLDGTQKVTDYRPPGGTLYPGRSSYWKVGLYRDTGNSGTATADLTGAALGESYDAVRPAAGGPDTTTS